jgi:hypothetical protein
MMSRSGRALRGDASRVPRVREASNRVAASREGWLVGAGGDGAAWGLPAHDPCVGSRRRPMILAMDFDSRTCDRERRDADLQLPGDPGKR